MTVRVHVQTRGRERSSDYRFLGDGPTESWWATRYGNRTAFERPTVLVERDEDGVRAYLGAIPSCRLDPAGATNRVSIVAEADHLAADERMLILALVQAWIDDIAVGGRSVANALDEVFDEDTVARLYGAGDGRTELAASLVVKAARTLDEPEVVATTEQVDSWIAPIRSEQGRADFVRRTDDLLSGRRTGSAVLVNLTDDKADFTAEARTGAAVLVEDGDGLLGPEPKKIILPPEDHQATVGQPRIPGKARPRRRDGRSPRRLPTRRLLAVIAAVVLLLVGAVIAVAIGAKPGSTQNPAQNPQPPPTNLPAAVAPTQPGSPSSTSPPISEPTGSR